MTTASEDLTKATDALNKVLGDFATAAEAYVVAYNNVAAQVTGDAKTAFDNYNAALTAVENATKAIPLPIIVAGHYISIAGTADNGATHHDAVGL